MKFLETFLDSGFKQFPPKKNVLIFGILQKKKHFYSLKLIFWRWLTSKIPKISNGASVHKLAEQTNIWNVLWKYFIEFQKNICVFSEDIISVRIYEILMNSYESSIIYGVPGQHLMGAPSARFEIQPPIWNIFQCIVSKFWEKVLTCLIQNVW